MLNTIASTTLLSLSVAPSYTITASPKTRCLGGELWQPPCSVAVVARPFNEFSFDFSGHGQEQNNNDVTPVTSAEYQQLLSGFDSSYLQPQQQQQTTPDYSQYGIASVLPSQMSAPEPQYTMEQSQMLASAKPRQMSQVSASHSSHYGTPYQSPPALTGYQHTGQSRKRSFQEDYSTYEYPGLQQLQAHGINGNQVPVESAPHGLSQGHTTQLQPGAVSYQYQPPRSTSAHSHSSTPVQQPYQTPQQQQNQTQHHHHRLPNQQPPNKLQRTTYSDSADEEDDHGPPSVVGQPGMPAPASRPKGPKLKFTPEDDALLVELKETKNLTWKQIADFFPGRSSGTLQVRYCTKLKAKTTVWTDEMVRSTAAFNSVNPF